MIPEQRLKAPWEPRPLIAALSAAAAMSLAGCKNDDATLGVPSPLPPAAMVSLSRDVQPIFNRSCALSGCHSGGSPQAGMSLVAGKIFDPVTGAVGVPSQEAPGLKRIDPGSSLSSYLVAKLEDEQASVGGSGSRMPFGSPPLDSIEIQVIREWIDQGAQDN
jgi:hypothetical protein